MRMGAISCLSRRGCAGDHTHALFPEQSHSFPDNVMALFGAIRAWNCSAAHWARTGRISALWNRIPIERCPGQVGVCCEEAQEAIFARRVGFTVAHDARKGDL